MIIVYQDELGIVCVEVSTEYGITFDGVYAYFNDTENRDYRVPIGQLVSIG